jgi:putative membrane protein
MRPFSPKERAAIARAISRAESKTSGEIVVVAAAASGRYYGIALMWAALAALTVPLPLILFTTWPIELIYLVQLAVFAFVVALAQWEFIRFTLVPTGIKRARAHQRAVEQFLIQNLHTTSGRTGVLIYVSFAERFAEIIADDGIYKKVPHETWQQVIDTLTGQLGRGERRKGFLVAIKECGRILAKHFPPGGIDHNELPNHLIVLDAQY